MSSKKGLGRLYDRLTPEERFRLDVLAMARGDEEESERLTATCPRRDYTMYDWAFVGRWEAARDLSMLAYVDVVRRLDKIKDDSRLSQLVSLPEHHLARRRAHSLLCRPQGGE